MVRRKPVPPGITLTHEHLIYIPRTEALAASGARVRDALVSLSIAEIRPTVSLPQLIDTVNELHAAVEAAVQVHQLYVSEVVAEREARKVGMESIAAQVTSRRGASAEAYRTKTLILMEDVRRSRKQHQLGLNAATLAVPVI